MKNRAANSDLGAANAMADGSKIPQPDMSRLIRELRARIRLTQEKLAYRLGVTFPTINRWENGRAKPSPLALKQIEIMLREMGQQGRDLLDAYFERCIEE